MSGWRDELKTWDDKIQYVFRKKLFPDLSFSLVNKGKTEVYHAHQFVFILASEYFEKKFMSKKGNPRVEITLTNIDSTAFELFLSYVYYHKLIFNSINDAINLYPITVQFCMQKLQDFCMKYVESNLTDSTYCAVLKFAERHKIESIKNICKRRIQTHTKEILCKANYSCLDKEAILLLLDQNMINMIEYDLFKEVVSWMKYKQEEGILFKKNGELMDDFQDTIIGKFRFLNMSEQQLAEGPGRSNLLTRRQYLAILDHITNGKSRKPYPDGFSVSIRDLYNELSFETSRFKFKSEAVKVASIFFTVDKNISITRVRVLTQLGNNNEKYKVYGGVRIMECSSDHCWDWRIVADYSSTQEVSYSDSFYINFEYNAMIEMKRRHSMTLEFDTNTLCRTIDLNNFFSFLFF